MPILMPADTRQVVGENAAECDSRSLFMDRFADPAAKKDDRKKWFDRLCAFRPAQVKRSGLGTPLFAQLQSRLMVNMAGGTMENAGLCLDRFGMPFIPGAAVKGCARRMAIQELLETDNATAKTDLLVQIALVFGWGEQDWSDKKKDDRFVSDFAYAVGDGWQEVSKNARERLPRADNFAGTVSFLPAHPVKTAAQNLPLKEPELGELELDVLTCHHPDYYSQKKDKQGQAIMPVALDTEDPNPVIFPAVAAGHVFAFVLLPLRAWNVGQTFGLPVGGDSVTPSSVPATPGTSSAEAGATGQSPADTDGLRSKPEPSGRRPDPRPSADPQALVKMARQWLKDGLQMFGLGAKTAAGYGWFEDVTSPILAAETAEKEKQAEEARRAKEKADIQAARASIEPDAAFLGQLDAMKEQDLRGTINLFTTDEKFWTQKDERRQLTILYWLLNIKPDFLASDRTNPKSKIAKAIANLTPKFPQVTSERK
jgi:CRISPR type III-B/RAMP module RAMP protein Cmr6